MPNHLAPSGATHMVDVSTKSPPSVATCHRVICYNTRERTDHERSPKNH